jgi:anti-sigma regulatory factor (Ser/Thr protein kinase)
MVRLNGDLPWPLALRDDCRMTTAGGPGGVGDVEVAAAAEAGAERWLETGSLALRPDPSAAREARAWVVDVLDGWPEDSVERARLLVSELVTNAVLHARTDITVRCEWGADRARFEVGDGNRGAPTPKRYVADSLTGRGMRLVAVLAESWGVERTADGKVVWFTVAPVMAPPDLSIEVDPLGVTGVEMLAAALVEPAVESGPIGGTGARDTTGGGPGMVHVKILDLPLELYLEAEQHNDAVLRELDLIERSSRRAPQVPARLLELASELRAFFTAATTSTRAQVEEAIRTGQARVNLDIEVPAQGWEILTEMAVQLDEVDQFCRDGALLTLAASPRQRRFRHWYANQMANQMRGHPPTPWTDDDGDRS